MPHIDASDVHKIVIACDAGMGSSAMLASTIRKQLADTPINIQHTPVDHIPPDADIIICHTGLLNRTRHHNPNHVVIPFQLFINDPTITQLITKLHNGDTIHD